MSFSNCKVAVCIYVVRVQSNRMYTDICLIQAGNNELCMLIYSP